MKALCGKFPMFCFSHPLHVTPNIQYSLNSPQTRSIFIFTWGFLSAVKGRFTVCFVPTDEIKMPSVTVWNGCMTSPAVWRPSTDSFRLEVPLHWRRCRSKLVCILYVYVCVYEWKNDIKLCSAIIRNGEALGGKSVSHEAVKKVSFQLQLPRCPSWRHCSAVSSKRLVQRQRKHGWQKRFEFEERPASVRGLTAVVEGERVVWAVTEDTLVSQDSVTITT